jgi:pyruvate dehydrogenase E2 component (dihydrolipoamide acetyltransferase)
MVKDIKIPNIGEKVESGLVVGVLVNVGDTVAVDQPLLELETDKAVVEIPSPEKGRIAEILVKVDDEVKIGQVIARIEVAGEGEATPEPPAPAPKEEPAGEKPEAVPEDETEATEEEIDETAEEPPPSGALAPAAPSVRRLARELGADINRVTGTGPGGRISGDDVKAYVKKVMTGVRALKAGERAHPELPDFSRWGDITREKMSKIRTLTAAAMSQSWNVVTRVTQFDEADITELETFRTKYKKQILQAGGKLTITAILVKVLAAALQRFPRFNASLDLDANEIIYKNYYHIGIAVDTDRGLIVPVIRNADKKSIRELAVDLTDLGERTRNKKIKPDELEGGTFTISNQGGIGGTNFTPIVYWPQAAILGVSRSHSHPGHIGEHIESRTILPLALSYDHRIVDGADAARFLHWVVDALEHPLLLSLER